MHGGAAETGMGRMQRRLSRVLLRGPGFSARETGTPATPYRLAAGERPMICKGDVRKGMGR